MLGDVENAGKAAHAGCRRRFLGCPVDLLTMQETVDVIDAAIARGSATRHVVVNVAKLVACQNDAELQREIETADIVNVDGMGIVWGARLCGIPVPERVTGIDLMDALLQLCREKGYRPYFLGGRHEILVRAVDILQIRYPKLQISGYRDGYFKPEEEAEVVAAIRAARADLLFVAMPSPKKEQFNARHGPALGVPFIMGVGGSIDVIAGYVRRAPVWMQRSGLEWAFRLGQEPRRLWRRYFVTNARYASLLARELTQTRLVRRAGTHGGRGGL